MPIDEYWYANPRLLSNYIAAKQRKINDEIYLAWLNGAYARHAMNSCVVASVPILGKMPKMPEYPDPPIVDEQKKRPPTEEEKLAFQTRLYMHYKSLVDRG